MSRCSRCGLVFLGYETYCPDCREYMERVYTGDERRVREWTVICGEVAHGKQPEPQRKWWTW